MSVCASVCVCVDWLKRHFILRTTLQWRKIVCVSHVCVSCRESAVEGLRHIIWFIMMDMLTDKLTTQPITSKYKWYSLVFSDSQHKYHTHTHTHLHTSIQLKHSYVYIRLTQIPKTHWTVIRVRISDESNPHSKDTSQHTYTHHITAHIHTSDHSTHVTTEHLKDTLIHAFLLIP